MHELAEQISTLMWCPEETKDPLEVLNSPEGQSFSKIDCYHLLSTAAERNYPDIVKELISRKTPLYLSHSSSVPLHEAITEGFVEIVRLLLNAGALPTDLDNDSRSALHVLADVKASGTWGSEYEEILKLLQDFGGIVDSIPIAACFCELPKIQEFVKQGLDPDDFLVRTERTALHIAALLDRIDIADYLLSLNPKDATDSSFSHLDNKTDIDASEFNYKTPLDLAETDKMKALLRTHGAHTSEEIEDMMNSAGPPLLVQILMEKDRKKKSSQ